MTRDKIVIVTADLVTRERDSLKLVSLDDRRALWLETLLDLGGEFEFAFHAFAVDAFVEQAGVFDADRRDGRECRQDVEMFACK